MPGRGLQYLPMNDVPEKWDRQWFIDFCRETLALADVRNAIEGAGISIEGNSDTEATIGTGTDVEQLIDGPYVLAEPYSFLANARTIEGENGVIDIDDDGPGQPLTVGIREGGVKNAKLRPGRECSVIGRSANSVGFVADILAAANDRLLTRISDVLAFSQLTVGMAPDDLWTYAKLQNISAQFRILGRKSASAGDTEECTLSEVLDFIGSAAQGDILYRGSSAWARLAAGSSGQFLQTQGAGANPQWAAPSSGGAMSFVSETTVAGAAATDITVSGLDIGTDETYYVQLALAGAAAGAATLSIFFNGDTTAGNYERSINGTAADNAAFTALQNNLPCFTTGYLRRCPVTGRVIASFDSATFSSSTAAVDQTGVVIWDTSANLTSFTINSSVASQIAIGSMVRVWKLSS
jgi:hypothetical protein